MRVIQIASNLEQRGLPAWVERDPMTIDVDQMCNGIESSNLVVVFITKRYLSSLSNAKEDDHCRLEYGYARRLAGVNAMIPVLMEQRMLSDRGWCEQLGIDASPSIKMWDDDDIEGEGLERLIKEILRRVPAWKDRMKQPTKASERAQHHMADAKAAPSKAHQSAGKPQLSFTQLLLRTGVDTSSTDEVPINYRPQSPADTPRARLQAYLDKDLKQEDVVVGSMAVARRACLTWL